MSALQAYYQIFSERRAELISDRHQWTEGPAVLPTKNNLGNGRHDIIIFSDVPQDKMWIYKEGVDGKDSSALEVFREKSGDCEATRGSNCSLITEPGSNGLAVDEYNNYLIICQVGGRRVSKIPLNQKTGMPLHEKVKASNMNVIF